MYLCMRYQAKVVIFLDFCTSEVLQKLSLANYSYCTDASDLLTRYAKIQVNQRLGKKCRIDVKLTYIKRC